MAQDAFLEQIAKLIEASEKRLSQKIETVELKIETVNERTARIETKLDREVTDLAETQRAILIKLDKLDDHETRISQLEAESTVHRSH